jgi:hypothetical protein
MSQLSDALAKVLEDKDDKNYDPRMEELMRSDKLIDPNAENLSKLEDPEIFHVAKIRGAQKGMALRVSDLYRIYNLPEMKEYKTEYMDYVRNLDPLKKEDKEILNTMIGGLPMTNEMIRQLISLRGALEAWKAKLYADSIKPQVVNNPGYIPQNQDQQEGFFSKALSFLFGKKEDKGGYQRRS